MSNAAATRTSRDKLTPMMQQYYDIKRRNPSTVLLYRMGDFYELFHDDARIGASVLGLTLTSRNHGGTEDTPLAGFPHHALERYAQKLVTAGYKIAVCEQVEDPAKAKKVVKREVTEVITAGTATGDAFVKEKWNNYIVGLAQAGNRYGCAVCDLSTGEFTVEEIGQETLLDELVRIGPSEMIVAGDQAPGVSEEEIHNLGIVLSRYDSWRFDVRTAQACIKDHFGIVSLDGMGLGGYTVAVGAAGALLSYLKEQKKNDLAHIAAITPATLSDYADVDRATVTNLELLRPLHSDERQGTLISVLDKTATSMGARLLRRWITRPLRDPAAIERRLTCVQWLKDNPLVRREAAALLRKVADLERLTAKVTFERANARDLNALKNAFLTFPDIQEQLAGAHDTDIGAYLTRLDGFEAIARQIEETITDSPPLTVREGGIIRTGVDDRLDELQDAAYNGKQWIANLQHKERERTGIGSLKVAYNRVFGYYIEVSKANLSRIPDNYIRKQTLVNAERFVTPELKQMEEKILGAQERMHALEYSLFTTLRQEVARYCRVIQQASESIAAIDVFISFAEVAARNRYCRPAVATHTRLDIQQGRHPVIEEIEGRDRFVPNDLYCSGDTHQVSLITGPNMAGKSTFLRQNALIILMAQMGSFVPAEAAHIGVVDRFFTRIGASDRIARGQSTFLVEMAEVANILHNATDHSFVLLDEVGRGTSTFDGVSIAWAVAEFIHETEARRARTLFATHYHELTELAQRYERIVNLHITVKEWNEKIIFLRKVQQGSCDHSYGIQVARLAGVPEKVVTRARQILGWLEGMNDVSNASSLIHAADAGTQNKQAQQTDLFVSSVRAGTQAPARPDPRIHAYETLLRTLRQLDLDDMTPVQALVTLDSLKKEAVANDPDG
jgi:DNA mismatch repair protein MutS